MPLDVFVFFSVQTIYVFDCVFIAVCFLHGVHVLSYGLCVFLRLHCCHIAIKDHNVQDVGLCVIQFRKVFYN